MKISDQKAEARKLRKKALGAAAVRKAASHLEQAGLLQLDLFGGGPSAMMADAAEHLSIMANGIDFDDAVLTATNLRYAGEFMVQAANEMAPEVHAPAPKMEALSPREQNLMRLSRIFSAANGSMTTALDAVGDLETEQMNQMVSALRRFAYRLEEVAQAVHLGRAEALGNNILLAAGDLEQAAEALGVKRPERRPTDEEMQAYVIEALSKANPKKKTA